MARGAAKEEPETCSLCPPAGPPRPASDPALAPTDDLDPTSPPTQQLASPDRPDLQWIGCSKCSTWLHSVCVYLTEEMRTVTIPEQLRDQAEATGEPAWFDWPKQVNRWYCKSCIDFSQSPDNPRRPKAPLATTLKKPRRNNPIPSGSMSPVKRARMSPPPPPPPPPKTNGEHAAAAADALVLEHRPKRKAALERPDYNAMHNHTATPTKGWLDLIKDPAKHGRVIKEDGFPRVPGHILCREWVESGTTASDVAVGSSKFPPEFPPSLFAGPRREPLVVRPENGGLASMGGMVPDRSLTVDDVSRLVGPTKMVDVIDVASQTSAQWPLAKWAEYIKRRSDPSAPGPSKTYNIISLEISGTELAQMVRPPRIVAEVDWVEQFWPFPHGKENTMRAAAKAADGPSEGVPKSRPKNEWPKVQLYCLMGMKDSWTDWHIDFAASSVYYNVHTGSKVFFFIRPTEANLAAYTKWSGSEELQASTWLPDMCDEVRKVTLVAGDTMIIPAGYIHAVYTPVDSIVFGGNFVHSYDIPTELRLRQIEIDTKVPQRFRFPFFDKLCWHVAERSTSDLRQLRSYHPNAKATTAVTRPHDRVLHGLVALARFLINEVHTMEDPKTDDKQRKLIWNRIPTGIRDPAGLAHELLWRAEQELPDPWEDEEEVKVVNTGKGKKRAAAGKKATAAAGSGSMATMRLLDRPVAARSWKFSPSPWEQDDHPVSQTSTTVQLPRPGGRGEAEDAEHVTAVYHQCRKRTRREAGETVEEEQDLVFTETRVVWRRSAQEEEVKVEEGG